MHDARSDIFYSINITKSIYVITIHSRVSVGIHKLFCIKHAAISIKNVVYWKLAHVKVI